MSKTAVKEAPANFKLGVIPDQKKADALTKSVLGQTLTIKDEDSYIASWAIVQRHDEVIALLEKGDEEKKIIGFDVFVDGLHKMHKAAVALRKQFVQPILDSKEQWMKRRLDWRTKIEAENKKKAEAESIAKQKEQAKALEKDAKKLDRAGETEAAEVLREQAAKVPAPVIPVAPAAPRQAGQVITKFWDFTVEDYSQVPDAFRLLDPTKEKERAIIDGKLNAVISHLGDSMKIPGVKIFPSERESSRAVK